MNNCKNCGELLQEKQMFCGKCGTKHDDQNTEVEQQLYYNKRSMAVGPTGYLPAPLTITNKYIHYKWGFAGLSKNTIALKNVGKQKERQ